jgi:ankyrin repeat protein
MQRGKFQVMDQSDASEENLFGKNTPLITAAECGQLNLVKELIAARADVNAHGFFETTALIESASHGHIECVKVLIEAGANIDGRDREYGGNTALIKAAAGHTECVKKLISVGANINVQGYHEHTPLMMASAHIECLKVLIAAGADVNMQDESRKTALIFAAIDGNTECVNELIVARANIDTQDNMEETALSHAAYNGHTECVRALIVAAAEGHVECVEILIAARANINMTNKDGHTALLLAARMERLDCMIELIIADAILTYIEDDKPRLLFKLIKARDLRDPRVILAIDTLCTRQKSLPASERTEENLTDDEIKQGEIYLETLKNFNCLHKKNIYQSLDKGTGEKMPKVLLNMINQYINPLDIGLVGKKNKCLSFFNPKKIDYLLNREKKIETHLSLDYIKDNENSVIKKRRLIENDDDGYYKKAKL